MTTTSLPLPLDEATRIPGNKGIWVGVFCVLVEFGRLLEAELLARPTASPTALSLWLADTPIVARDAWPGQDTRRAFGAVDRSTR